MADTLWNIHQNIFTKFGGKNFHRPRYSELFPAYVDNIVRDNRSASEIVDDIKHGFERIAQKGGENA